MKTVDSQKEDGQGTMWLWTKTLYTQIMTDTNLNQNHNNDNSHDSSHGYLAEHKTAFHSMFPKR